MRPSYHPRLVNPPGGDPAVFVPFAFENRAVLFDLGDLRALSPRDMLKITHVFVSHTHMDHFIGFDALLRVLLGRSKTVRLFGPPDFLARVEAKLGAYTWNLVDNFSAGLTLEATEVRPDRLTRRRYRCRDGFRPSKAQCASRDDDVIWREATFAVRAALLDHRTPCLGFALQEREHINIRRSALDALGLPTGAWLRAFKEALIAGRPPQTVMEIPAAVGEAPRRLALGDLADRIAVRGPGQKIAYVTDVADSRTNRERILQLAAGADQLFIESTYRRAEEALAAARGHLTAPQAGRLAGMAGARRYTLFHFSPRYTGQEDQLAAEAQQAYADALRSAGGAQTREDTPYPA